MTNLEEAEKRIVELCERAEAKGDWEFKPWTIGDGVTCGCPLQLAARELGLEDGWVEAGDTFGFQPGNFGIAFDRAANGEALDQEYLSRFPESDIPEMHIAERLARRFVHKEGAPTR